MNALFGTWRSLALLLVVTGGVVTSLGSAPEFDWGGGGTTSVSVQPPPDNPPTYANAGEDQTARPGMLVQLDGEGFDREGPVSPGWRQETGPAVQLSNSSTWNPTFTAPAVAQVTELRFLLRVFDGKGQVGSDGIDRVSIWVDPDMPPPTPVLLDFESLPDGSPTVEFQPLANDYQDECVIFENFVNFDASAGPAYRHYEPTNMIVWDVDRTFNPPPETTFNITLDFTVAVDNVSADVFAVPGQRVVLTVYDRLGVELASLMSAVATTCCSQPIEGLEIGGIGPIYRARFETDDPFFNFPIIDNVSFHHLQACGP